MRRWVVKQYQSFLLEVVVVVVVVVVAQCLLCLLASYTWFPFPRARSLSVYGVAHSFVLGERGA